MSEINSNDPAVDLIVQAIDEINKIHGNQFNSYSCEAYATGFSGKHQYNEDVRLQDTMLS